MKRFLTFVLVAALGVAAWIYWPKLTALVGGQGEQEQAVRRGGRRGGDQPTPVIAAVAKRENVPVTLDGVGTFQAQNTATVRAQVDGIMIEVAFREGQDVKAGDVLARIDPSTYQAQYDQAVAQKAQYEAQLANAQRDFERYQRLAKNDFGSQQQAETAKASVAQLQAQVRYYAATIDQAKATLDRTVVRAPIDGRTGVRGVDQGNYVTAGDTTGIVTITQLKPISAVFTMPQQNIPTVVQAMARGKVAVEAVAGDGASLDAGTLDVIDNQVDQTTGTVKLKASFPNDKMTLWPGQFITVRVFADELKDVVTTPGAAVQQGPDGPYVFVVQPDATVTQREVTVGRQSAELAVIEAGVEPGDKVVTTGFTRLRDGSKVTLGDGASGAPSASDRRPNRRAAAGEP
ncbi:efflux RND transporter periplasmic adaptor subunit [Methylopila sp. Yamaguchi]|uniref:efflux RND transporter periplasmic adaptor subunit n=1 Tax=Methylopila sp. Yamaguchi TaxID=1437817 RepID=UPI000CA8BD6A|nr:efflux RND transporter periplasmic adaptor subunit [Methylopila sp. Yamaguchi]GBD49441.1 efflux transporter, RND family, MFP subunit [Methylopila sp. Yamaguchi]